MKFVKDNWKDVVKGVVIIVVAAIIVTQLIHSRQEEDGTISHKIGLPKK